MAVALGIAGLLLGRSGAGGLFDNVRDAVGGDGEGTAAPLAITSATPFDPSGDGRENGDLAPNIFDGDPGSAWRTEGYNDRDITRLKDGVGIILELGAAATLEQLELQSPTNDWKAVIYVAGTPAGDLAGWGDPVATTANLPAGTNVVDLGGAQGRAVLVWIIDRGDARGRAPAEIQEARLLGR